MGWFICYDPTGLDSREGPLLWIRVKANVKSALGKLRTVSLHCGLYPSASDGVIVLRENVKGTPSPVFSWGKVCAEEEKVATFHGSSQTAQKRERIEIGKDAEESNEAGGA